MEDYLNDHGVYADVDIVFDEEELSDSDDSEDGSEDVSANQHILRKNLSNTQRQEVYEALFLVTMES